MNWNDIPSLSSLRAFEAAARLGSFSKAARELNVTHAAIAQHVRSLENEFSVELMTRSGRGMAVTSEGLVLAGQLAKGFEEVARGVSALKGLNAGRPLSVTSTLAFSENWLMPRLPDFWSNFPEVKISISPSYELVDLRRDGYDLAIRFGKGTWSGLDSILIVPGEFSIVASPEVAHQIGNRELKDLTDIPWLKDKNYPEPQTWLRSEGFEPERLKWYELPSQTLLLAAIRAGGGITAVNRAIVNDDIKAGRLTLLAEGQPSGQGYYLVSHKGVQHPDAGKFGKWLRGAAKI